MKSLFKSVTAVILGVSISTVSHAVQHVQVEDAGTYQIKISATELTRIAVKGGRIEKVWALNTVWDTKPDKDTGELYIKPKSDNRQPFSFFVRDSLGNTYTLIALNLDVPSEAVILEPKTRPSQQAAAQAANPSQSYVTQIKSMVRDMVDGNKESYLVEEVRERVQLWKEVDIELEQRYTGVTLVGEEYQLTNVSGKALTFDEREFSNFGQKVRAVALKNNVLAPHESTSLFVVRGL